MPHEHYDLERMEREMRASAKLVDDDLRKAVADGRADNSFAEAQFAYTEARLQFMLATMRAENAGCAKEHIAEAAGRAIGGVMAGILNGLPPADRMTLLLAVSDSMTDYVETPEGLVNTSEGVNFKGALRPEPAGRG